MAAAQNIFRMVIEMVGKDKNATATMKTFGKATNAAGKKAEAAAASLKQLAGAFTSLVVASKIAGGVQAMLGPARKMELSMMRLGWLTGQTTDQLESMRKVAEEVAEVTTFGPQEAVNAMGQLVRATGSADVAMKSLQTTASLAMASFGKLTLEASTRMVSDMAKSFSMSGDEIQGAGDKIMATSKAAGVGVEELNRVMGYLGTAGYRGEQSFNSMLSSFMLVRRIMPSSRRAATQLQRVMGEMTSEKAQKSLRTIGVETLDAEGHVRKFSDILLDMSESADTDFVKTRDALNGAFGESSMKPILSMLNLLKKGMVTGTGKALKGAAVFEHFNGVLDNSKGAVKNASDAYMSMSSAGIDRMSESFETLLTRLGDELLPALGRASSAIADTLGSLMNFFREMPGWVKWLLSAGFQWGILAASVLALKMALIGGLKILGGSISYMREQIEGTNLATAATEAYTAATKKATAANRELQMTSGVPPVNKRGPMKTATGNAAWMAAGMGAGGKGKGSSSTIISKEDMALGMLAGTAGKTMVDKTHQQALAGSKKIGAALGGQGIGSKFKAGFKTAIVKTGKTMGSILTKTMGFIFRNWFTLGLLGVPALYGLLTDYVKKKSKELRVIAGRDVGIGKKEAEGMTDDQMLSAQAWQQSKAIDVPGMKKALDFEHLGNAIDAFDATMAGRTKGLKHEDELEKLRAVPKFISNLTDPIVKAFGGTTMDYRGDYGKLEEDFKRQWKMHQKIKKDEEKKHAQWIRDWNKAFKEGGRSLHFGSKGLTDVLKKYMGLSKWQPKVVDLDKFTKIKALVTKMSTLKVGQEFKGSKINKNDLKVIKEIVAGTNLFSKTLVKSEKEGVSLDAASKAADIMTQTVALMKDLMVGDKKGIKALDANAKASVMQFVAAMTKGNYQATEKRMRITGTEKFQDDLGARERHKRLVESGGKYAGDSFANQLGRWLTGDVRDEGRSSVTEMDTAKQREARARFLGEQKPVANAAEEDRGIRKASLKLAESRTKTIKFLVDRLMKGVVVTIKEDRKAGEVRFAPGAVQGA